MGHNRFLEQYGEPFGDPPSRVFARIDQADEAMAYFDAVDADWFESAATGEASFERWRDLAPDARIYVIGVEGGSAADGGHLLRPPIMRHLADEGRDQEWLELTFSESGLPVTLYENLFADGRLAVIGSAKRASPKSSARLTAMFDLTPYEVKTNEIERVLAVAERIDYVAVYDVGQGNANAVCSEDGAPLAYFDFGGGVLANANTFSPLLTNFCFTLNPPIVLSHWDWDHWSSGNRFTRSLLASWIVPNQSLGAVHATFAAKVLVQGRLLVWPAGSMTAKTGRLTVHKCNGFGRNHSGLAMEVAGPWPKPPILLPGDARYSVIAGATATLFTSVVVPHHGADMRNRQVPGCAKAPECRAAYSVGSPNSFNHPRPSAESDHHKAGWSHAGPGTAVAMNRRTSSLRSSNQLGHIGLGWGGTILMFTMPCGGQCSLGITQT